MATSNRGQRSKNLPFRPDFSTPPSACYPQPPPRRLASPVPSICKSTAGDEVNEPPAFSKASQKYSSNNFSKDIEIVPTKAIPVTRMTTEFVDDDWQTETITSRPTNRLSRIKPGRRRVKPSLRGFTNDDFSDLDSSFYIPGEQSFLSSQNSISPGSTIYGDENVATDSYMTAQFQHTRAPEASRAYQPSAEIRPINQTRKAISFQPLSPKNPQSFVNSFGNNRSVDKNVTSTSENEQFRRVATAYKLSEEIRPTSQARKGFSIQPLSLPKPQPVATSFGNNQVVDKNVTPASCKNEQVQLNGVLEMNAPSAYETSNDIHPADEVKLASALFRLPDKDFSFQVQNEMILAHKFVLASQSQYFYQQFIDNYDNCLDTVNADEFDKEVVELAVRACYDQPFDETTLDNRITKQLIKLATTFDIRPVLELLPQSLSNNVVTEENLPQLAIQSIETNDSDLFERCVAFVADCLTKNQVFPGIEALPVEFDKAVVRSLASNYNK